MAFFEIKEFTEDYKKGIDFYTVFSINYIRDLQFYNFFLLSREVEGTGLMTPQQPLTCS